jgi:regulator of PEP synthase PpsR (kinase-PPPase family)
MLPLKEEKKEINIHLMTDFTGNVVKGFSSILCDLFKKECKFKFFNWFFINENTNYQSIIDNIKSKPGIVIYTLLPEALREILYNTFNDSDSVLIIPILESPARRISRFFRVGFDSQLKRSYNLNDDYFRKIDAMNYAIDHDDGRNYNNLHEADIVLIGVSRSSKTPLSIFLSYQGLNVANIPFATNSFFPDLSYLKNTNVVMIGLTIDPVRLQQIRINRSITGDKENIADSYIDIEMIEKETNELKKICAKLGCYMIDVTMRSMEELAAKISSIRNLRANK